MYQAQTEDDHLDAHMFKILASFTNLSLEQIEQILRIFVCLHFIMVKLEYFGRCGLSSDALSHLSGPLHKLLILFSIKGLLH